MVYTKGVGNSGYGVQLALPEWFIRSFTNTFTRLPVYRANGSNAPKYKPTHWHDWMVKQTKPWKPPARRAMKTPPGPDTYTLETIND